MRASQRKQSVEFERKIRDVGFQPTSRGSIVTSSGGRVGWRPDDGQSAIVVLAVAAALLVVFLAALVTMGGTAIDRTRAQTAADAAALASVTGDRGDAVALAAMHGAIIVSWERGPGRGEVTVVVRIGDVTATARATDAP